MNRFIQIPMALSMIMLGLGMQWSCKKADTPIYDTEVIVNKEEEPCIKFVHPVWVDEVTELDDIKMHYNFLNLKAFVKNYCNDTVKLAMRSGYQGENRLYTGSYRADFLGGGGYCSVVDDLIDSFYIIPPGDSLFMSLIEEGDISIWRIERYSIGVNYVMNKKYYETQFLKIEKKDFNTL